MKKIRACRIFLCGLVLLATSGCFSWQFGNVAMVDRKVEFNIPTPSQAAEMTFSESPEQRRLGVVWLASADFSDDIRYVRLFRLMLDDESPSVRAAAARALGLNGYPEETAYLLDFSTDESVDVRREVALALRLQHIPGAGAVLSDMYRNELALDVDVDVRLAAVEALAGYPSILSFQTLVLALEDDNMGVRLQAEKSLNIMTEQSLGSQASDWLAWFKDLPTPVSFAAGAPEVTPFYARPIRHRGGWAWMPLRVISLWQQPENFLPRSGNRPETIDEGASISDESPPLPYEL